MPISLTCAKCGKAIHAPDQLAGKRARCPHCKAVLRIPDLELPDAAPYTIAEGDRPVPTDSPPASESSWRQVRATTPPATSGWQLPERGHVASTRAAGRDTTGSARDRLYWVLLLALVPLGFSLLGDEGDTEERVERTLDNNPQIIQKLEAAKKETLDDLLNALPGNRIEGAHLPRKTWMHWLYALLASAGFFGVVVTFFRRGSASPAALIPIGLFTGTIGIFLLLGAQWAAMLSGGIGIRGRSILVVIILILKLIGFSYQAALDPSNGFVLSFFGFTCGVGLCEELCKAMPIIMEYRRRSTMGWRGACLWGLASGVGFGVSEGITYSADHYNGVATGGIYLVRFISCVALHAMWAGAVGITIYRDQASIEGDMEWTDWFLPLGKFLGVAMVLHGLYDTMLKREMNAAALVVAVISFAWLAWCVERARRAELGDDENSLARA